VVFLHEDDIASLGFSEGDFVDIISEWEDGSERQVPTFRIVAYDQPRGCAAAYYPETNPLVPLEHTAEGSNQPASKSVIVRLEKADGSRTGYLHASDANRVLPPDRGDERKRHVQPHQMS
jgi:anaerobic selenocysteine-containing dehydrogenase